MRFFRGVFDRRRVWKELPSYPVYSPPFHDAEMVLAKHEIQANYEYFLEQKALRVELLTRYLASFSVALRMDHDGVEALDGWIFRYGGHLLPLERRLNIECVLQALREYEPAWSGPYAGLNVINDIGIFVGDYIIAQNPDVRWDMYYGDGTKRDYDQLGFGKPCLYGLGHMLPGDPYPILGRAEIYEYCRAGWLRLRGESELFWPRGELIKRLKHLTDRHLDAEQGS